MALLFSLKEFGQTFATRARGEELRSEFLSRAEGEDVATIDFTGITNISYSFADEFVGVLVSDRTEDDLRLQVINATGAVNRVLQRAMNRRRGTPIAC